MRNLAISPIVDNMIRMGLMLALFAMVGTGILALTHRATASRIAANERNAMLERLNQLLPIGSYDNVLLEDTVQVSHPSLLGSPQPMMVYRGRLQGQPVGAVLTAIAPDGYSGAIRLLVGIRPDGSLLGVRVTAHQETPGLGDLIDVQRSGWILGFTDKSLDNPPSAKWAVKKDGGVFDQFTGATISPRAVVKAVHQALQFYRDHPSEIWQ